MPEKFKIIDSPSDIKLRVIGKEKEDLFNNAFLGMLEILKPNCRETEVKRKIKIKSEDEENLLIDFLNELLQLMRSNNECYSELEIEFKNDSNLKAKLKGFKLEGFGGNVKSAMYYNLKVFKNEKDEFECEIVFDI